ncbi:hypothetical protein KQH82_03950 [bacterium]|nr:hypothetical protein [bacterium]
MKSQPNTIPLVGLAILFMSVAIAATSVNSQTQYWQRSADPRMVVVPDRSAEDITTDLDNAIATRQLAMRRNTQAVDRLNEIERSIQDRDVSIADLDRRKDDAKDNKHPSQEASLKIEANANKKAIDLLKRLRDLRKAEVDVARVEEEYADKTILVFQMEQELQGKRSDYRWQVGGNQGDLTRNTDHQVITELEEKLLKLQKDAAESMRNVASEQKDVVSRRMKLHEAQTKLGM